MKIRLKKEQVLLLSVLITLILILSFKFFYQPRIKEIIELRKEASKISSSIKGVRDLTKGRGKSFLKKRLLKKEEIPKIMAHLTKSAEEKNLNLVSLNSKDKIKKEFYKELPVEIKLSGSYLKMIEYLKEMTNYPFLINIEEMEIKREKSSELKMKLLVKVYVMEQL